MRRSIGRLWRELDLGSPPFVRRFFVEPTKRLLLPLAMPFRKLRRLRGHNQVGPLAISSFTRFPRELLFARSCFFTESEPEDTPVRVPFWRIPRATDSEECDLMLIRGGRSLIRRLPRAHSLVLPARVTVILDVRDSWSDITRRFRKSAKASLRVTERNSFDYRVSHDEVDFERFYRHMYLPTIKRRHGSLANPMVEQAARVIFKRGLLFFLRHDDRDVVGSLCQREGKMLKLVADGIDEGELGLMKQGFLASSFIYRFRWAKANGFEAVSFMSASPCLSDRLLRSKRRWGSAVHMGPGIQNHLWLQLKRLTPAVERCLLDNPFIVFDERGNLSGLVVVPDTSELDDSRKRHLRRRHATPGLEALLACTAEDLLRDRRPLESAIAI